MKLHKPWMINLAARASATTMRVWLKTVRCHTDSQGQQTDAWDPDLKERYIYTIWHESLIFTLALRSAAPVTVLVSQSRDGDLLSKACAYYGAKTIRGSSTRGGMDAIEEVLALNGKSHLIVAPDGPKGPRRELKRGLIYLSAWSGLPIVPLGVGFENAWRVNSWDHLALPKPFSKICCVAGPVTRVPKDVGKAASERLRQTIEREMEIATLRAEARAVGKHLASLSSVQVAT